MTSIEQAARRLEELRRAGAEVPEVASAAQASAPQAIEAPTPEALVRALEPHAPSPLRSPATIRHRREPHVGSDVATAATPEPGRGERRIEINLAQLHARGFVTPNVPTTRLADEFRVIKRPIIRNAVGSGGQRIKHGNLVMVTSALPREGKTFTSVNLAMSIAMEFDSTVLLVDGDVAHPSFPTLLGSPHRPGLLDLLTHGDIDVGDALVKTNVERLTLLPAGARHRRSTELLASEQMASLLRELSSRYADRIVIFDSPPLLATTEARVLASHMGQVVMVVAADSTTQNAVNQALATIETCDVVLMVLNKASRTDVGAYYGYYGDEDNAG